ncbi:hypothetical protein ENSA5_70090 [Enhygromyxa salina]|uniref:Uncharacterized protein n=1 Tax=Enhygromyxa salina TaxID=215803 RepID=A0A2S9XAL7_9BACT|nr:hypothetical protein [Enhygromyxa salina]PRP89902.1 hypothetical protein ENSA5_70090 [Enhygromyxa salina]
MSFSFDARFQPTSLDFAEVLRQLEFILPASGIDYDGEIARLHSRSGVPTVTSLQSESVPTLADIATYASSWWGVGLYCISRPLAEALGRTDSMEVYINIFKARGGGLMVEYNENSGAFRARRDSTALSANLIAFLTRTASALEVDRVIYSEEVEHAAPPELSVLIALLEQQAQSDRALETLAIVSKNVMSLEKAQQLAGAWAPSLRLTIDGFVVAPFLGGERP